MKIRLKISNFHIFRVCMLRYNWWCFSINCVISYKTVYQLNNWLSI